MRERPASVIVFAILNLLFSGLVVLMLIGWLVGKLGIIPQPPEKTDFQVAMESNTAFTLFNDILVVLALPITVLVIAASIGMFTLKPWARLVTVGWGVYSMFSLVATYIISYFMMYRHLLADMTGQDLFLTKAMMIGGAVVNTLLFAYFLLMTLMLCRAHVVEAFRPLPEQEEDWYDEPSNGGDEQ